MYTTACSQIARIIFGMSGYNRDKSKIYRGTAFAIQPNTLVTTAHSLHTEENLKMPLLETVQVHNVTAHTTHKAKIIIENAEIDTAILKIEEPFVKMKNYAILDEEIKPIGSDCGVLGYPLSIAHADPQTKEIHYQFIERFKGAHISASRPWQLPSGKWSTIYELDIAPYPGSSGSPVFLSNEKVIGMLTETKYSLFLHAMEVSRNTIDEFFITTFSTFISSRDIRSFALENGIAI